MKATETNITDSLLQKLNTLSEKEELDFRAMYSKPGVAKSAILRNATLQILLERSIGGFHFNEDVLMVACGNVDGTDVEEFDSALKNRLMTL